MEIKLIIDKVLWVRGTEHDEKSWLHESWVIWYENDVHGLTKNDLDFWVGLLHLVWGTKNVYEIHLSEISTSEWHKTEVKCRNDISTLKKLWLE